MTKAGRTSQARIDEDAITAHPDFSVFSDARLDLHQNILQERIDFAQADGNAELTTWLGQQMRLVRAERAHRGVSKAEKSANLVLQEPALHGLAGEIVRAIEPFTEADPVGILVHLLVSFGNVVGSGPHWTVEKTPHHLNLFAVLLGDTAHARKGTSRSQIDYILRRIEPDWQMNRCVAGLSSGQGLIWNVRDPISEHRPIKEKGKIIGYEDVVSDPGETDKRLCVVEEEFCHALKSMPTEGNILSVIIRSAWDSGNLRTLTSGRRAAPVRATGAYISILGHITKAELLRYLDSTEQASGFANRFLWFSVKRSKSIPNPKAAPDSILDPLVTRLGAAIDFAKTAGEIRRDDDAEVIWEAVYPKLTEDIFGMVGAITARAAPQVMRLASVYALLDASRDIRPDHLRAALALWDFSFSSARAIFGETVGDSTADKILDALKASTSGLSATEISGLFNNHQSKSVDGALAWLLKMGVLEQTIIQTGGRPKTIYIAKNGGPQQ